jgi:peptidyl-prolyl cis-trans isomerase SurA
MTNFKLFPIVVFSFLGWLCTSLWAQPITPTLPASVLREIDFIVALVNSEPITRNDVAIQQSRLQAQWAAQGVASPPAAVVFKRVLDQLIEERVTVQIGKDIGVKVSDGQLNDAILSIARQNDLPSVSALQTKYEAEGGSWSTYRDEIRSEMIRVQVREREVEARVRVSESEIDQVMQEQSVAKNENPDINLAQILIALPDEPTPEQVGQAKQKAEQIAVQARGNSDFAKLAAQFSDSMDKTKGGLMGLRAADRYPSLFVDAVLNLKVGAVTEPLRSDAGFHILKLVERVSSSTATTTQSLVRHILLRTAPELSEVQAKSRLEGFKNQIEQGRANFETLAKEHSADGSSTSGGELGWAGLGRFVPEFERVVNSLPIGKVSAPFVSRFGVHILEVMERREVAVSLRDQRALIQAQVREKKTTEANALWLIEARARAFVEYKNIPQ